MLLNLKMIEHGELAEFWRLAYEKNNEWRNWDGPYFKDPIPDYADFVENNSQGIAEDSMINGIYVDGQLVGMVSAYFSDGELRRWLEIGIVIYDAQQWGKGIGAKALKKWITRQFATHDLPHIGLTTWSGNQRMIKMAQRIGLNEEARIPQVRFWQGMYWDSVKYGILREDWENLQKNAKTRQR